MSTVVTPVNESMPAWAVAEMPPGYKTRSDEIARLSSELREMDRLGRLLWTSGPSLRDAVRDALMALRYEPLAPAAGSSYDMTVALESGGRLLIRVVENDRAIEKKSPELMHVFQAISEAASDRDRVVLIANHECATRPADRSGNVLSPEALDLVRRLGANVVSGATLFKLWTQAMAGDRDRARAVIDKLHAQNGGMFPP